MDERKATALLKQRFEAAGFKIAENVALDADGVEFEVDGYDAERRVGYEYVSRESGDGWDVDENVVAELAKRHDAGELSILVIDENDAPDEVSLGRAAEAFLSSVVKAKEAKEPKAKAKPKAKPAKEKAAKKSKKK